MSPRRYFRSTRLGNFHFRYYADTNTIGTANGRIFYLRNTNRLVGWANLKSDDVIGGGSRRKFEVSRNDERLKVYTPIATNRHSDFTAPLAAAYK